MARQTRRERRAGIDRSPVVGAMWSPADGAGGRLVVDRDLTEAWQQDAWRLWHLLGELRYPTGYVARAVGRLDWVVTEGGTEYDIEQSDDVLAAAVSPAEVEEITRMVALNLLVAGAAWVVRVTGTSFSASELESWRLDRLGMTATDTEPMWLVLSVVTPNLKEILERADRTADGERIRLRVWEQDPVAPWRATSEVQAALDPADDLLTLSMQSRVQSKSRLLQGGLLMHPIEVTFPDGDDPFGEELLRASSAAIKDPSSPSSLVPIDVEMPGDRIDQVKWLLPDRPYDDRLDRRVETAVRRIAVAENVPAELLLGLGAVNHWGQWLLMEDTFRQHVEPVAGMVSPVLEWMVEVSSGRLVQMRSDSSAVLQRPRQVSDLVTVESVRPGTVTRSEFREALDLPVDETDEEPPELPETTEDAPSDVPAQDGRETPEQAPATAAAGADLGRELSAIDTGLRERLSGALAMLVHPVRARVGARLRTQLRNADESEVHADVPNVDLAAAIGGDWSAVPDIVDLVANEVDERLSGWWDDQLAATAHRVEVATGAPVSSLELTEAAERSSEWLVSAASAWLVAGLSQPLVDASQPPQSIVRGAVGLAGGQDAT